VRWTSALSTQPRPADALREACTEAASRLEGAPADLAFLFVGGYAPRGLESAARLVRELTGARRVLGCTAGGVIGGGREIEQRPAVSLTLASLPGVEIIPFHVSADDYPDGDAPPSGWHHMIGIEPERKPAFVLLPDPWSSDSERLLAGLDYAYPNCIKIGGLASGARHAGGNRLFLDDTARDGGTVGIALAGNLVVETAVAQGCRPVGAVGRASKSQGHYLLEIDGQRAFDFVQKQFDEMSDEERDLANRTLFLGIAMDPFREKPPEAGDFLIRNFVGVDPQRGVVAVNEEVGVGRAVQLHVRDAKTSTDDLVHVLKRTLRRAKGARHEGALLFSCLGRGRHLYGEADKDTKLFQSIAGEVPLGGFFCNGEIGPIGKETYLHGFTSSFGLFREPAPQPG